MKLLFLGGTQFVGLHMAEEALARGHQVSLFNRGSTNPDLFPQAEKLRGDRDGGLDALKGKTWDAVIDVNGYVPRLVRASAELLKDSVGQYIFISTLGVYADRRVPHQDENAPLATTDDPATEQITGETYGPLKVLCEQAAEDALPGRTLVIRPGFIVGPHDHTDRLTYWLRRIDQGGEMLVPQTPDVPLQFVDGRDLAAFTIDLAEQGQNGIYNVTGPGQPYTWGQFFDDVKALRKANTTFTWVDEDFLAAHDALGMALPIWPPTGGRGLMQADIRKAIDAGLRFRPLAETVNDTLAWDAQYGTPRAGMSAQREADLLRAWHARA